MFKKWRNFFLKLLGFPRFKAGDLVKFKKTTLLPFEAHLENKIFKILQHARAT